MELDAAPTHGTPAPYGRACSTCARAKAKCVLGIGVGVKCERCLRLNKDCQPLQTVRKRKAVNKLSASKTERLEEKLDGLYKLLKSSTPSTSIPSQNTSQPPLESLPTLDDSPNDGQDFGPRSIQRLNRHQPSIDGIRLRSPTIGPDTSYTSSGTRSTTYHCPESSLISGLEPSSHEAEEYLNIFRTHMATYFPFIFVPVSTTAHELRRDRPFLWLCIMSVASKSTIQQKALATETKITMGREVLVEGKNNLDLLLGLLVFVAWGHYHVFNNPVIVQTARLAIALLGNLGLNKPPLKEPTQTVLNLDGRGCPCKPFSPSTRTMEERRAVLGCFLLSSVLSQYYQRFDALRWTPYLDECVAVLAGNEDLPTDTLLAHLIKLHLIVEEVGRAPWHEGYDDATGSARAPPTFYLKALQAQLHAFKAKIPPGIQRNDLLLLYLYSTEVKVQDVALAKAPAVFNNLACQRLDSLHACLIAAKTWFDVFLSLPPASYVGFSIPIFIQMSHCIIILFKLSTLDDPVWDRGLVRETADLSLILGQIIEKHRRVRVAADLDHGAPEAKDIFSKTAGTVGSIKTWWDAKLAAESINNMATDETLGERSMELLFDDAWLNEILGQGDCQI